MVFHHRNGCRYHPTDRGNQRRQRPREPRRITFVFQAVEETGATPQDVVRAYSIAREAFGLKDYWREVAHLDMQVPTEVQDSLSLQGRRIVGRAVRWLLRAHHHR